MYSESQQIELKQNQVSAVVSDSRGALQDDDVCRICRSEAEPLRPLLHPCKCSGSIKYVHQDCLLQWLKHSGMQTCEVCKHPFSFTNKYKDDAPQSLGVVELLRGLYLQARGVGEYFWRVLVCSSLWLTFQPLIMASVWRAMLVWPLQGVRSVLPGIPVSFSFLLELSQGAFISVVLALLHIFSSQVIEAASQLWVDIKRAANRAFLEIHEEARMQQQTQNVCTQQQQQNDNIQMGEVLPDDLLQNTNQNNNQQEEGEGEVWDSSDSEWEEYTENEDGDQQQNFRGHFGGEEDGEFDVQDVSIEEFIGLTGPISNLFQNFAGLTMANAFMLFLILFIPMQIGRVHLYGFQYFVSFMGLSPGEPAPNDLVLVLETIFRSWNAWDWGRRTVTSWHPYFPFEFPAKFIDAVQEHSLFPNAENLAALMLGYVTILVIAVSSILIYGVNALLNESSDKNFSSHQTVQVVKRFFQKLFDNVGGHLPQMMLRLKLSVMFVIELGLFSYMVGYWIEVGALPMWGGNYRGTWEFWRKRPIFSGVAHWLIGLGYVLCFHTLIRSARRILKPTALTFLKDPESPDFDPWEEMKNEQIQQTLWRLGTATLVHTISIFSSVHLPVRIAARINPNLFPLQLKFSEPLLDLFLGLGLFQIGAPAVIPHLNISSTIDKFMANWLLCTGRALRLEQYLLPNFYLPAHLQLLEEDEHDADNIENDSNSTELEDNDEMGSLPQQQCQSISYQRRIQLFLGSLYSKFIGLNRSRLNNQRIYKRFKRLRLRVFVLANLWFLSVITINTCVCVLPLSLGRLFGALIGHPQIVDLHSFVAGSLLILFMVFTIKTLALHRLMPDLTLTATAAYGMSKKICKILIAMCLWQGVVCYLTGFLVINTFQPFMGPFGSMFIGEPLKEISIGLAVLITVKKVVIVRAQIWPQLRQVDNWENRLVQLNEQGWQNLDFIWSLEKLIIPTILYLGNLVIVPYSICYLLQLIQGVPKEVQKGVQEYSYALWTFSWLGLRSSSQIFQFTQWLHDAIRDELYLEDRLLNNLDNNNSQNRDT